MGTVWSLEHHMEAIHRQALWLPQPMVLWRSQWRNCNRTGMGPKTHYFSGKMDFYLTSSWSRVKIGCAMDKGWSIHCAPYCIMKKNVSLAQPFWVCVSKQLCPNSFIKYLPSQSTEVGRAASCPCFYGDDSYRNAVGNFSDRGAFPRRLVLHWEFLKMPCRDNSIRILAFSFHPGLSPAGSDGAGCPVPHDRLWLQTLVETRIWLSGSWMTPVSNLC